MTAPTMFLAADPDGRMTLWADDGLPTPVAWLDGQRIHVDPVYAGQAWQVLTAVLAPDEATLMLLSHRVDSHALTLDDEAGRRDCVADVLAALTDSRDPLAALAGTSAQARHTADDEAGGA